MVTQGTSRCNPSNGHSGQTPWRDLPELARVGAADLIAAIGRDISDLGIVGEKENCTLIYAGFTSRLLNDPLALIGRGPSGSGKSTTPNKISTLFPPSQLVNLIRFTDASLFNTGRPDYLKHKILLTGERKLTDDPDQNSMIRQLLSEKRLTRSKSETPKDGTPGRWATVEQELEGPVAFYESTTARSIFDEDLNRMVEIWFDDSEEQNQAVVHSIFRRYRPCRLSPDKESMIRKHVEFQESLKTHKVAIPYWEVLATGIPTSDPRCRRVAQQICSVIEAIVVLHQHHRALNKYGELLATVEDYRIARSLLIDPLMAANKWRTLAKHYRRLRAALPGETFTSNDCYPGHEGKQLFNNEMTRNNALRALVKAGVLKQTKVGKSGPSPQPAEWRWLTDSPNLDLIVLPSVQAVEECMRV